MNKRLICLSLSAMMLSSNLGVLAQTVTSDATSSIPVATESMSPEQQLHLELLNNALNNALNEAGLTKGSMDTDHYYYIELTYTRSEAIECINALNDLVGVVGTSGNVVGLYTTVSSLVKDNKITSLINKFVPYANHILLAMSVAGTKTLEQFAGNMQDIINEYQSVKVRVDGNPLWDQITCVYKFLPAGNKL